MEESTKVPVSGMEIIYRGIGQVHTPGSAEDQEFVSAIYSLFNEYRDTYYKTEWARMDENARIYEAKYWDNDSGVDHGDRKPRVTVPVITSSIENIKADLMDELPEAIILPDVAGEAPEVTAKVLTKVVEQELDACDFEGEYAKLVHDYLQDGWGVWEAGHDPLANGGLGGTFIRHVMNKNFMCDPQTPNLQDGRACFVLDIKTFDWLRQHYPEQYPYMSDDGDISTRTDRMDSTTTPNEEKVIRVIEMWVKEFDTSDQHTAIHFVRVAGHQVLEDSKLSYPRGYYENGRYPFRVCPLYPQKGSALGLGICDLFKDTQRYSDKLQSILMENALRARQPRMLVNGVLVNVDDARDFEKEVIETEGPPSSAVTWMETKPLPSYLMNFSQLLQQSIKNEAGSNDQSRGQTGGGVTATGAITALQDMSTKRSRMEARELQRGFKECVRMMLEIAGDKDIVPRNIPVTISGETRVMPFDKRSLHRQDGSPIETGIAIKTARQTRFTRMAHNELILQFMNQFAQTADPLVMMEAMEIENKEKIIEQIRKAQHSGMLMLQQQNQQMQEQLLAMSQELEQYRGAMQQLQGGMTKPSPAGDVNAPSAEDAQALTRAMA